MQQNELSKLLGISPAMTSRLAKRGMPTDTLERAQRWRKRHLEPGRVKGSRFDPNQPTKPTNTRPAKPPTVAAAMLGDLLAKIETAGANLDKALTEGDKDRKDVMIQQVRELLRAIPDDAQPCLTLRAWLALVDWIIHSDCQILRAPDKSAMLTPVQFGMRWHGWENYPLMNEHTLDHARDWGDIAINGWPECPSDDKLHAMITEV
jgi:hypothetical protein